MLAISSRFASYPALPSYLLKGSYDDDDDAVDCLVLTLLLLQGKSALYSLPQFTRLDAQAWCIMASKENDYPMKRLPSNAAILVQPNAEPKSEQKYSQDEADLARYGKKQQLKVRSIHFFCLLIAHFSCWFRETAPFWIDIHNWTYLYANGHLGRIYSVCRDIRSGVNS